jgi:hypothetical protein
MSAALSGREWLQAGSGGHVAAWGPEAHPASYFYWGYSDTGGPQQQEAGAERLPQGDLQDEASPDTPPAPSDPQCPPAPSVLPWPDESYHYWQRVHFPRSFYHYFESHCMDPIPQEVDGTKVQCPPGFGIPDAMLPRHMLLPEIYIYSPGSIPLAVTINFAGPYTRKAPVPYDVAALMRYLQDIPEDHQTGHPLSAGPQVCYLCKRSYDSDQGRYLGGQHDFRCFVCLPHYTFLHDSQKVCQEYDRRHNLGVYYKGERREPHYQ